MPNDNQIEKNNKKGIIYRISILNDTTHEKLFSYKTTARLVSTILICIVILYTAILYTTIAYTPIRKLIPGYPNINIEARLIKSKQQRDSIINEMILLDLHLSNIENIISGGVPKSIEELAHHRDSILSTEIDYKRSRADSLLRERITTQTNRLKREGQEYSIGGIEGLHLFKPIQGVITTHYNVSDDHPYLDIAATENSVVSAILAGTVISAEKSTEFGYSIQIQHSNNLISVYRHNSKLLIKRGEKVEPGTAISMIGKNGGTLSTGPHLHFELWHNGYPIDPEKHINF